MAAHGGGAFAGVAFMLYRRPANPQAHVPPATPLPFIGALHRTNEGVPSPSLATAAAAHRIFGGVKAPQPGGRRAAFSLELLKFLLPLPRSVALVLLAQRREQSRLETIRDSKL